MKTILLIILLSLFIGLIIVWIRDVNRFVIVSYEVESEKLKQNATIVLLADLHNKAFGKRNEKLYQAIEESHPDMIMIAGDMLTAEKKLWKGKGEKQRAFCENAVELMDRLTKRWKVYYANGNHEQKLKQKKEAYGNAYEDYLAAIKAENLCMLENKSIFLPEFSMEVSGLEIERKFFKRINKPLMQAADVEEKLGKANREAFQILLAHNPEHFKAYEEWGADLTLSGHIHGGIMRLFGLGGVISPSFRLFPKYDGGLFEQDGKQMILSRGLGTHTLPVRIFNPGELIVLHCKKENG